MSTERRHLRLVASPPPGPSATPHPDAALAAALAADTATLDGYIEQREEVVDRLLAQHLHRRHEAQP